ncbi:hypothetical protein MOMA_06066 [Moraxella macacae 0408225]|uniref:Uncharacterized protein n=1 Tax=Moraxella macacae 0408225 TaxID=1230338 RepID=L2F6P1_9GAMM|nr:hypothetical protein [Moraxella macacae]ELA08103.1 hypothetical protein MOMA_06066 [Moraxella macacae 0408225]
MPNTPSLLLIGFTETNANVIQIFLEMTFKNIQVNRIIRNLGQTTFELPTLSDKEQQSDVFIIDFEGVGLDLVDNKPPKKLKSYTNNKPILFITRQNEILLDTFANYEFLTIPYTRQQMTDCIKVMLDLPKFAPTNHDINNDSANIKNVKNVKNALNILPKNPNKAVQDLINESFAGTKIANSRSFTNSNLSTTQKSPNLNNSLSKTSGNVDEINQVFALLSDIFTDIAERPLFSFAKKLQSLTEFSRVTINGYQMYINPIDKSVISDNLERIGDGFVVGIGLKEENLLFQVLDINHFRQRTANLLELGAKQYSLTQVIWFIGLELMQVRRNNYGESHCLQIQATFMPNFAGINFVPNYVVPLIASCLGRPRTLLDFNTLFPQLTNAQVNQVLLLLIMSNAVNNEVLLNSYNKSTQNTSQNLVKAVDNPINTGIQKANKTGFWPDC